jgi:murein endopeptidase
MSEQALLAADCKLYLSPRIEALADMFPHVVHVFVRDNVRSFKIGRGLEGLLRPDKIVAYFDDRAHMHAVADALAHALRGCSAQGVPFTAEAGGDGLLSWGIDPPPGNMATSWRAWVTKRLAASLTKRRRTPGNQRVAAALDDLRRIGIDPELWLPNADAFLDGSPG